jgi:hypothetical protein
MSQVSSRLIMRATLFRRSARRLLGYRPFRSLRASISDLPVASPGEARSHIGEQRPTRSSASVLEGQPHEEQRGALTEVKFIASINPIESQPATFLHFPYSCQLPSIWIFYDTLCYGFGSG